MSPLSGQQATQVAPFRRPCYDQGFWLRAMALRRQVRRTAQRGTETWWTTKHGGELLSLHVIASSDCCASDWWGRSPHSTWEKKCATANARLARQGRKTGGIPPGLGTRGYPSTDWRGISKGPPVLFAGGHPPSSCFPRCIRFVSILMRGRVEEREERALGCFLLFEQRCRVPRACR